MRFFDHLATLIKSPRDSQVVIVTHPEQLQGLTEVSAMILTCTPSDLDLVYKVLKPGAHLWYIPEDLGDAVVSDLEDLGFEVRDTMFLIQDESEMLYSPKATVKEKTLGLTEDQKPHPTTKPVGLMSQCIQSGVTVLDPFMGSGTTGVASVQVGAKFIGIEQSSEYFEIARNRIDAVSTKAWFE